MSGSDRQPLEERMQGRPATVTIKTSDQTASRPSDHMLAEHNLQRAPCFRRTRGHIPSSRCSYRCRVWRRALGQANSYLLSGFPRQTAIPGALLSELPKEWWRRTGSNRRPDACKATALPAELRPLIMVGLGRLERPTSPLSGVRSNHLSYRPRAGRPSDSRFTQRHISDPAIRMRKRNEGGRSKSRQSKP